MTAKISQDLKASGIAPVVVILTESALEEEASKLISRLEKSFTQREEAQTSALASAGLVSMAAISRARQPAPRPPLINYYPNLGIAYGVVDREGLASLRAQKEQVANVSGAPEFSLIRPEHVQSARLPRRATWGIEALGVPELWNRGFTGNGVKVGHLDTGADGQHPTLREAIGAFAEFDFFGRRVQPDPKPYDTDDHGTHTAGTIAGRPVQGRHIGVAPDATLVSAIVIEQGDVVARVLGGMDWCVGEGVRVLSLSLGLRGWWEDFEPIVRRLRARGVLPVFAIGNEGPGTSRSPGNYREALSVGASDKQKEVAYFSSSQLFRRGRGPIVPDLVAPGVNIASAKPDGGYQAMDGTSMATPHVAGLAALLMQARPNATMGQIERAIFKSCSRPTNMLEERGSRGIPNAVSALQAL